MKFLLQFRGLHNDLRVPEFLAVVARHRGVPSLSASSLSLIPAYHVLCPQTTPLPNNQGPAGVVLYGEIFYFCNLESEEEAIQIASVTVLLRAVYVPVGHGINYSDCIASIDTDGFKGALNPLRDEKRKASFRCVVDAWGKSLELSEQLDRIHRFGDMLRGFPGKVKLKGADEEVWILEDAFPIKGHGRGKGTERQVLVGRKVATGDGGVGSKFSLKRRRYIGPTSMDAELAFVMANMGAVGEGDLVLDPFCGTGGIMVACKARGAHVIGGDINILALRGKGNGKDIESNFKQYGLDSHLGLLRMDVLNSAITRGKNGWFDAVICDPPYGIKEGMKAFREDTISPGLEQNHFQGTERVRFIDFLHGILDFAVNVLVEGGRLVYWLPTTSDYKESDVPRNVGLELISNCEQPLTQRMSRRLITMRRVSDEMRETRQREELERNEELRRQGLTQSMPAHFDLACKLLRQPQRAEQRLRARNPT